MGYAMFAARKVMLTNQINMLGLEQLQISNERMKLTRAATAVADGEISSDDYASLQGFGLTAALGIEGAKASKITDPNYLAGLWTAEKEARNKTGLSWMANIGGAAAGVGIAALIASGPIGWGAGLLAAGLGAIVGNQLSAKTQERNKMVKEYKEKYEDQKLQDLNVEEIQAKIAEMENMLDMRQQKLDTELQAYNNELEQVKNAEKQGIKNATPNYAGQ